MSALRRASCSASRSDCSARNCPGLHGLPRRALDAADLQTDLVGRLRGLLGQRLDLRRHDGKIASTIAAAVEQQGAATKEISRNVQHAANGTSQVSANIFDVKRGAGEIGQASLKVLSAARSLSGESSHLKADVETFLSSVRSA
jgi:methyl-accepting chemotaxis protein